MEIQKALKEDATVYEYDSIYDEMQQKKKESSAKMLAGNDDKKVNTENVSCLSNYLCLG